MVVGQEEWGAVVYVLGGHYDLHLDGVLWDRAVGRRRTSSVFVLQISSVITWRVEMMNVNGTRFFRENGDWMS